MFFESKIRARKQLDTWYIFDTFPNPDKHNSIIVPNRPSSDCFAKWPEKLVSSRQFNIEIQEYREVKYLAPQNVEKLGNGLKVLGTSKNTDYYYLGLGVH